MKLLASSRDEPAIRYEMEKYGYTGVAFAKHRPMIKLEWDSIEVYCKRIQLENSLWGKSCVYLWRFGLCGFYSPGLHCLNEYLHSWDMELLVLMASFYCPPMAIRPLVLICYSLTVLGIKCLLWQHPSLMSIHYALHWITFKSSVERWMILID